MKANELRIGNYIKTWTGTNDEFGIVQVFNIDEDSIHGFKRYLRDAEPIKLTDEWFKRFGFKSDTIVFIKDGISFGVYKDQKYHYLPTGQISFKFYNEIKYVHQLQNLYFALTGEEL